MKSSIMRLPTSFSLQSNMAMHSFLQSPKFEAAEGQECRRCHCMLNMPRHKYPPIGVEGVGSNIGEDMDVCKCIVPSRQEGTLNSRRAAGPLDLGEKGRDVGDLSPLSPECSPSKLGWNRAKPYCHLHGAQSERHA
ncbi:hypothetical protein TNCV_3810271 [Trichonephila clavipes]|nr:hypothetical protein TNCV_3810271 [Trichonephila clavipes]